jgi:hypothetical protein
MTTAIDTNVIVALWDRDHGLSSAAQTSLDEAFRHGGLIVSAPVCAELLACPGRNESFLDSFFIETGISVDWILDEPIWKAAGRAFQAYAARRRRQRASGPRRILADFMIGAHALHNDYPILTLDDRFYRSAFVGLRIMRV